jgi:hypothetical protein
MHHRRKARRRPKSLRIFWLTLGVPVVAACALGTARFAFGVGSEHLAVFDRAAVPSDALADQNGARYLDMSPGQSRAVGTWIDSSGNTRKVLVAASNGLPGSPSGGPVTCVILEDPDGSTGGGCNPSNDFFGGQSLVWTDGTRVDNSGTPQVFVVGVTTQRVPSVRVTDSAGGTHAVAVTPDGGFFYELPSADREAGISPVELVAYSGEGQVVERINLK